MGRGAGDHIAADLRSYKGCYANRGSGFAGRIAYRTLEAASAQMEHHACFLRWEEPERRAR